jgi:hypothetical protein
MSFKVSTNTTSQGTAAKFGAANINLITRLLNGETDVADVLIDSSFEIQNGKLVISSLTNVDEILLPDGPTTLIGNDTTDTLTNKTLDATNTFIHADTHKAGGSDLIKLDELDDPTDVTTLDATIDAHGLLPKLSNVSNEFLNGEGSWVTPDIPEPPPVFDDVTDGLVPASGGGTSNFLRADATWTSGYSDIGIDDTDSPYTLLDTTTVLRVDATSGAITINLPSAIDIAGKVYKIYRTDIASSTNLITIDPFSTETIDSNTTYKLFPGEWLHIESDGANWQVIARPTPTTRGYFFRKGATANRTYIAGYNGTHCGLLTTTTAPTVNTLYALPLVVSKTTRFDIISYNVTTAGTNSARAGIYRDNGNCYPGNLMFDTGAITNVGIAVKSATITASLQTFQPGLYWLAWETQSIAPQIRGLATLAAMHTLFDVNNLMDTTNSGYGYTVAHTFGALPNPYTGTGILITTSPSPTVPIPAIGLRAV